MKLHIQILSTHNQSAYTYFDEVLHSLKVEPLVTIDNLYIATVTSLDKLGPLLSELLYICKQHYFTFKSSFDSTTCYITIND